MNKPFQNLFVDGDAVKIIFPTTFVLPKEVRVDKLSDSEIRVDVTYTVKKWFFTITRTGSIYYNADTGTLKFTV